MREIKEYFVDYPRESSLITFGIGLILVVLLNFPNFQVDWWQTYQPFIYIGLIGIAIIFVAAGAIFLTRNFKKMRIPLRFRPPKELMKNFFINKRCDVLHAGVTSVYDYSNYTKWLKNKISPSEIFAVCAFEPYEILNYLLPRYNEYLRTASKPNLANVNALESVSDKDFISQININFPHFIEYQEFFKKNKNITRILLLRDEMVLKRNPVWMFKKFKLLNGDIPCVVAYRNILEKQNIAFLTDCVIYNGEFIIDYYPDSNTLILSFLRKKGDYARLLEILNHYKENQSNEGIYKPLDKFIKDLESKI